MSAEFWVRSVSFVNDDVSVAIELSDEHGQYHKYAAQVFDFIARQEGLIAHNAAFETGVTYAMTGIKRTPLACTLAMSRYLANEGSPGQSWGLKDLATELLGRQYKGYDKDLPKSKDMAKAEWEKLGYYNQIDSHATWHLYKMMGEVIDEHEWGEAFRQFLREDFNNWLMLHFNSYVMGLYVDVEYAKGFLVEIEQEVEDREREILSHPDIAPYIREYNDAVAKVQEENLASKPKFTKKGDVSKNWLKAEAKLTLVRSTQHFNVSSSKQLAWLLYDKLDCEVLYTTDEGAPSTKKKALQENVKYGKMILDYRDSISYYKFLRSVISNTDDRGMIRINTKLPGTLTGRASSGAID